MILPVYLCPMQQLSGDKLFDEINRLGSQGDSFVFLIDAYAGKGMVSRLDEPSSLLYSFNGKTNAPDDKPFDRTLEWEVYPVSYRKYSEGFSLVMKHIMRGDTFLLNFTQPSRIKTNLTPGELFQASSARYKVCLPDVFTCFSPETFVTIDAGGKIASHPMKGTADASEENAMEMLLNDSKEIAEHHTIVDLIRNDLSRVAENVVVENFRYVEKITTNRSNLLQVSSKITGQLPPDWKCRLGDIFSALLPAGSVTGAPKPATLEIIRKAEHYDRGWYTGIAGIFDGATVDSGVMIRFVENQNGQMVFKSGGGVTFQSKCRSEYQEMLKKIYVPVA